MCVLESRGRTGTDVVSLPVYVRKSILQVLKSLDPRSCCLVNEIFFVRESCYYVQCEKHVVKDEVNLNDRLPQSIHPQSRT